MFYLCFHVFIYGIVKLLSETCFRPLYRAASHLLQERHLRKGGVRFAKYRGFRFPNAGEKTGRGRVL